MSHHNTRSINGTRMSSINANRPPMNNTMTNNDRGMYPIDNFTSIFARMPPLYASTSPVDTGMSSADNAASADPGTSSVDNTASLDITSSIKDGDVTQDVMSGVGGSQGSNVIPNGQPPQWNYSSNAKLRVSYGVEQSSSITSNGTPSHSYAGSLSSQSSRDPSPIPPSVQFTRTPESLSRSSPDVQQQYKPPLSQESTALVNESSFIPLPQASQRLSANQHVQLVNGPQVTSVPRTGSVPPSSHSIQPSGTSQSSSSCSSTSTSSYSSTSVDSGHPRVTSSDSLISKQDGQSHSMHPGSNTSAYLQSFSSCHVASTMGGSSHVRYPPSQFEQASLVQNKNQYTQPTMQSGPSTSIYSNKLPSMGSGDPSQGPHLCPPASMSSSNFTGSPASIEDSNYAGPPQGPSTSLAGSNLGPHLQSPLTRIGGANIAGPPPLGPPVSIGGSNLVGPLPAVPPTSMGDSNFVGPPPLGLPTTMGGSNVTGSTASIGSSTFGGPQHMGPPGSMGGSNLVGLRQMGPPTSMGSSNRGLTPVVPPSMGGSNLVAPPSMGPSTSMGGPNILGAPPTGHPTNLGGSNLPGPLPVGPPISIGSSNLVGHPSSGPPTSMGISNFPGPPPLGPPTAMGSSNFAGSQPMGPPTSMGSSSYRGPSPLGVPTSMGGPNIAGPLSVGPPTSMGGPNLSGPPSMGPLTSMVVSNRSGPPSLGPPTSSTFGGPQHMGPPGSMGVSNLSGPSSMGPPTSIGRSNLSGPPSMLPPTSIAGSNLSGPPSMVHPTSIGSSNLSGPPSVVSPTSIGGSNLSGPPSMGPPTSMGVSNLSGLPSMGPPTSIAGSNLSGPSPLGPPTSMGVSNFAGPPMSMSTSYPAGLLPVSSQRNLTGPPSNMSGSSRAPNSVSRPPTRPNQYPGAPTQPGSVAQENRQFGTADALSSQFSGMSVTRSGFNKIWGMDSVDLLQYRNVLPAEKVQAPKINLHQEFLDSVNCSPDIFRCTLTKIPESNSLLQKSRLPLGILIHPFKDLNHLPVIQCSTIVRCRSCRTYINPFVYFVDHKRWKCNLCFRVNELPEEFQYDPVSKTYGDPTRRPEIKSSTIEFIAPSEYMLRPPQPAVYLFLLDVSWLALECGYLNFICDILLEELDKLPGDGRMQIGFITYNSNVHFYNLAEGLGQPQQMIVVDTDEVFLPCPDNLLVNLAESRELVMDLLKRIPTLFLNSHDTKSALGPALQAAYKLMAPTGGRVTVFQSCLPNHGPGALVAREDPSQRAGKEAPHLNPATDFYKRLALDCSGQQIAVDLFIINSQYCDIATISGISRFSGGCIHHFPLFQISNTILADSLERCFRRYLTRKIGFEAVMRIRCSRGLAIHTFHGNFFVRSTDLLSLPNVNPDAGFGMQVSVEETLSDVQNICFQAALLYTSSKGERRIRVHTLCLPVAANLSDILYSADQQCIVGLLAKMAVDRSLQSSLSDARDAFINVAIDVLSAYKLVENSGSSGLLAPMNLRLLPLYILALLKYVAFRTGQSTRLDDRLFAMCQMKILPLTSLIQAIYPDLYPVYYLDNPNCDNLDVDGTTIPQPPRLHLSAEKLDSRGAFLMDTGDHMMMYIGHSISNEFCSSVLGVSEFSHIPEEMYELPEIESPESEKLRNFVNYLQAEKPYPTVLQVIRDDSKLRAKFIERLIEDRSEAALSYYEFLQHLKANIK